MSTQIHDASGSGLVIYVLSDGTGETAEILVKAALLQYKREKVRVTRHKNVRTESQVSTILEEARGQAALVVFTVVSDDLRELISKKAKDAGVYVVDILGPIMEPLSQSLTKDPTSRPGQFHQVNESYFKRIEAIEFTVKHDDGKYAENLFEADLILVGLSRTSKTPLSIYLAYKGWKVGNVPVVKGIPLPEQLFQTDQRKVVGLTIDPQALAQIRRERLIKMGEDPHGEYAQIDHVTEEIEYCKELFRKNRRWPVFDVTGKALEETASEVERVVRAAIPEKFGTGPI